MEPTICLNVQKKSWQQVDGSYKKDVKFLQVSTDEVYGSLSLDDPMFEETMPINPHSPYSASKASADMLAKSFYDTHSFPINITRCSNNYGPYQFPEKLIPLMFYNCKNLKSLPIYGNGLNVRDWLFVDDHCSAIDLVLRKGKIGEIYNIGGNNEKNNLYIVNYIIDFLHNNYDTKNSKDLIKFVEDRKGHDFRYAINSSKIKKELGWEPSLTFEEGMTKTLEWYLKNALWLEEIINGTYKK